MEVGHSLTLHSKWQLRGHVFYQVWIVYSALMKIVVHLSSRTDKASLHKLSSSLLQYLCTFPFCVLFLLIAMVCSSLNILW